MSLRNPWSVVLLVLLHLVDRSCGQISLDLSTGTWEQNGQVFKTGGDLADSEVLNNIDQLYDSCGNYRLAPHYKANSACEASTSSTQSFWYGQEIPGGHAMSVPGKPWIRQSFPYTCNTNPYNECPYPTQKQCADSGCLKGKKVGKPIIKPDGGHYSNTVLISIDVEGLPQRPNTLPSSPILPTTTFRNGLCRSACEGKPTYPACNDQLLPRSGVYGKEQLGGTYRSSILSNPCRGADQVLRRQDYSCRCNVDRLLCNPQNTFCAAAPRECGDVEGAPCAGDPAADAAAGACGVPALGGICKFGTWQTITPCIDDLTPDWPDSPFQSAGAGAAGAAAGGAPAGRQLASADCRGSVCSDHSQCVHIYYTLDGSAPTRSSRLYHGPFILETIVAVTANVVQRRPFAAIVVRAVAVQEGSADSDVVDSQVFNIKAFVADTGAGRLWAWGHNVRGQLGLGDGLYGGDPRFPNEIPGAPGLVQVWLCLDPVTQTVRPGLGCDASRWVLDTPQALLFNSQLAGPAKPEIAVARAGAYHTLAVTRDGTLMSWGWNGYGQLGVPTNAPTYGLPAHAADTTQRNLPGPVQFNEPVSRAAAYVEAAAGTFHSGAVDADGRVYMFGVNFEGQLCTGNTVNTIYPALLDAVPTADDAGAPVPGGARWAQIALGQEHTVLLGSNGWVYACGSNRVYQLGRPRFTPDTGEGRLSSCVATKTPNGCPTKFNVRWARPIRVLGNQRPLERVVKVAAGAFHSLALTADGSVYAWGDNRMNQLGQGPLVNRGGPCCGVWVPFYINNQFADLQPDGGPGAYLPGTTDPAFPWPGYKVLDIAAGADFSVVIAINISGPGCTDSGTQTGHRCVRQDAFSGLILQDWDIPRNVDLISEHYRSDIFDFSAGCSCKGQLHPPGGLGNCEDQAFEDSVLKSDGKCYRTRNLSQPIRCNYAQRGLCECLASACLAAGSPCVSDIECNEARCNRIIRTCRSACPCADRSCPAMPDDSAPVLGDVVALSDLSWYRRAGKLGTSCGCTPAVDSWACRNWRAYKIEGAMPPCCINTLPGAPEPFRAFTRAEWDVFNFARGIPVGQNNYGTCADGDQCTPADVQACLGGCRFPDRVISVSGTQVTVDGHPAEIGHKQTCVCYEARTCVGETSTGESCASKNCPRGSYCSQGGGVVDVARGGAPIFYGDCDCRNATADEWAHERWSPATSNISQYMAGSNRTLPRGVLFKLTFWNSNPCPYRAGPPSLGVSTGGKQWSGTGCRLVKLPFTKYVFGWGDTRAGQLGKNIYTVTSPDDQPVNVPRPIILPSLTGLDMVAIAAGNFHAAVVVDPQPHDPAVCNLTHIDDLSNGVPPAKGGLGPESVAGQPFYCDGRNVYTFGGNTEGELGLGYVTPSEAVDCVSVGNIRVPCANVGGSLTATRVPALLGRNVSSVALGYKHSVVLLGGCPATSLDRCGECRGDNTACRGCSGITNDPVTLDWCGVCGGDNTTCSGCRRLYGCQAPEDRRCFDAGGAAMACSPAESYHPCLQGRRKGEPCCLDVNGLPSTPGISDPLAQSRGRSPGAGPVPCSHFGALRWRDRPRAGRNYCGLLYDECSVCDGDHTRCADCLGVPNGRLAKDLCGDCAGLATACVGCDGRPEPDPAKRARHDACELCNGTNSTCSILLLAFNAAPPSRGRGVGGGGLMLLAAAVLWAGAAAGRRRV